MMERRNCCAAAGGTTIRAIAVRPIATGIALLIRATTSGCVSWSLRGRGLFNPLPFSPFTLGVWGPAWHTLATWFFFFGSTLLTGPLAVGISLLVTWQIQMRTAAVPTPAVASVVSSRATGTAASGAFASFGSRQPRRSSTQRATAGTGVHRTPHQKCRL